MEDVDEEVDVVSAGPLVVVTSGTVSLDVVGPVVLVSSEVLVSEEVEVEAGVVVVPITAPVVVLESVSVVEVV